MTIVDTKFQSEPHLKIHYTYDKTSDGSGCFEMLESVQTHSSLVWKVGLMDPATFVPIMWLKNEDVLTILDTKFLSQPHLKFHYTYDKTSESSGCFEMLESVQTHSSLVWKVGLMDPATFVPIMWLKNEDVLTILDTKFQSQPYITIHYTYDKTMEGSRCCEMRKLVQ